MNLLGELSLWIALMAACWCATASFAGGTLRRGDLVMSGERAMLVALAALIVSAAGLWHALLGHEFSIAYVASHTTANMPGLYTLAAFWSGAGGTGLLGALAIAVCAVIVMNRRRGDVGDLTPWAVAMLGTVMAVSLFVVCLSVNPYARLAALPLDGNGMDPQLQNPWAALHTPMLCISYATAAIACAFWLAAAFRRERNTRWPPQVGSWLQVSWLLFTIAVLVGTRLRYVEWALRGQWTREAFSLGSVWPWLAVTAAIFAAGWQSDRAVAIATEVAARRRVGLILAGAGITMLIAGVVGSSFASIRDVSLKPGDAFSIQDPYGHVWRFQSQGASRYTAMNRRVDAVSLEAWRDGVSRGVITSERNTFTDIEDRPTAQPVTRAGIRSTPLLDVYVVLSVAGDDVADMRLAVIPLALWVWIGGALSALGGLIAMRMSTEREGR